MAFSAEAQTLVNAAEGNAVKEQPIKALLICIIVFITGRVVWKVGLTVCGAELH